MSASLTRHCSAVCRATTFLFLLWGWVNPSALFAQSRDTVLPVKVKTPAEPYAGWIVQFQRELLDEPLQDELYFEYQRRLGFFIDQRHALNLDQQNYDMIVFNPYLGTYVNIRDEQRGYTTYMTRKLLDRGIRTLLKKPEFSNVRAAQETFDKVTNAGLQLSPSGGDPSERRALRSRYDLASNRAEGAYEGPEGRLAVSSTLGGPWSPLFHYGRGLPENIYIGVSYNVFEETYGTHVGHQLSPLSSVTFYFNGNIPREPVREQRATIEYRYVF